MSSEPSLAQRFYLVGRMLQLQPTDEVLEAFAESYPGFKAPDAERAEQDYLRLLVGLGMPIAPPWESAWASDARLLFQRETLEVRWCYREAGFESAALHHEPDDHLGLELEFIGRLLERGDGNAAAEFAAAHPKAWAARWNAAVQANAETTFYRQLAEEALRLLDMV